MTALLPLLLACRLDAFVTADLGHGERPLGTTPIDGGRADVKATWRAHHFPPPQSFMPPSDSWYVGYDILVRDGEGRILIRRGQEELDAHNGQTCRDRAMHAAFAEPARQRFERLTYESCANDEVFVFRVRDPLEDPPPWRAGVLGKTYVDYDRIPGDHDSCAQALQAVESRSHWERDLARGTQACRELLDIDPVKGLRCALRETDDQARGRPDTEAIEVVRRDPDLLSRALDANAADTTEYAPYRVDAMLQAADPGRLAAIQERLLDRCRAECLPWERYGGARIATLREDRQACEELLEQADAHVAAGRGEQAAQLLVGLDGCVSITERMRAYWTRPDPQLSDWGTCSWTRATAGYSCLSLADAALHHLIERCQSDDLARARELVDDPATPELVRERARMMTTRCRGRE